jgi:cobalamin biosynthesis protein CobD/CbiB
MVHQHQAFSVTIKVQPLTMLLHPWVFLEEMVNFLHQAYCQIQTLLEYLVDLLLTVLVILFLGILINQDLILPIFLENLLARINLKIQSMMDFLEIMSLLREGDEI